MTDIFVPVVIGLLIGWLLGSMWLTWKNRDRP